MTPAVADTTSTAADVLRIVSDPLRLRILTLLAQEQLCVCHLQEELGCSQTLASHHLRALRAAGLVDTEPCGRFTYYRLRAGAFDDVRSALDTLAAASRTRPGRRPC